MNCSLTGDDGVRDVAADALNLGDIAPYRVKVPELIPDGVSYWMTVLAVDDHGLAGAMPIGSNQVIHYTTPQIKPNAPVLTSSREYTLSGYSVRYTFSAPADDANPEDASAQAVERHIPLCHFAERGGLCPDPQASPTRPANHSVSYPYLICLHPNHPARGSLPV